MSDDQVITEEHHKRLSIPGPLDPRKAVDPAAMERVIRAQERARAQAAAATTVVIGTVVTLVSSAFGFVAALAWNDAILAVLNKLLPNLKADGAKVQVIRALVFTVVAIVAIVALQRIAGRWAKKAAIGNTAGDGSY
jgi:hypothetical protein